MTDARDVRVPDIGDFADVPVIEVLVSVGDRVEAEDPLVTLESDKATMDVPAPFAGVVSEVAVGVGDRVSEGSLLLRLAPAADGAPPRPAGAAAPDPTGAAAPEATGRAVGEPPGGPPPSPPPAATAAGRARVEPASAGAERDFDVVVLGAGPGGYTAAFRAADLGLRVALVERHEHLGGVCLNVGCIPSKALLHAARVIAQAQEMADHGIRFGAPEVDLERLADWKRSVVSRLTTGLASLARQRGVEVVRGDGALVGPTELVAGGRRLTFSNCIIAAGSRPATIPGLPDDERVIDSTAALSPTSVPKRLLVIGGGIIGMEMACVYDALGARVTVVELLDQLLGGCDPDIVAPLARRARARYEGVITGARVESVAATRDGLEVTIDGAGTSVFDRVLVAVGRTPNGREVGADAAGVAIDERGFIPVDDRMRTNVPGIFAIGDVTGGPMLAHKATHEGVVAAEACAGLDTRMDARTIPSVAYTDPEVAWTGLTETAAAQAGVQYEKAVFPWAASGRALGLARPEGMTKLLLEPGTRRLLGAGIVGVGAGELISEIALAIELGANAQDVALTVHPHPTLSETVAFAAQLAEGTITDLLAPGARGRPAGAAVGRGG